MKDNKIADAMGVLKQAMQEDPAYAYGWHANIAVLCTDAVESMTGIKNVSDACNEGASRFMKIAFDVETSRDMLTGVTGNNDDDNIEDLL